MQRKVSQSTPVQAGPVLISANELAARVRQLGSRIASDYAGRELTVVAALDGAIVFACDLIRQLPLAVRLGTVAVSAYPGKATSSCGSVLCGPLPAELAGRHILIVDDILDSGGTLELLVSRLGELRPASLRTCTLLRKSRPDLPGRSQPDYVGFEVENVFVIGYGLDYDGLYRNMPDIRVLLPPAQGGCS